MKNRFKKGTKVALFAADEKGVMHFSRIVYVAKVRRGFVSIAYSQGGQIIESRFEIIGGSNICRLAEYSLRKELRPIDEACERLEELRSLRDKLISRASNVEFALKRTDIETLSDLVGPAELNYFLEIADSLIEKLGGVTKSMS